MWKLAVCLFCIAHTTGIAVVEKNRRAAGLGVKRNDGDAPNLSAHFEGRLQAVVDDDGVSVAVGYINIRFGYCTCANGDLALALFITRPRR